MAEPTYPTNSAFPFADGPGPTYEAGEWPVLYVGASTCFDDSGLAETQALMENVATNLLWNWTKRVFGLVTEEVRPSRVRLPFRPTLFEGMGPPAAFDALMGGSGWGWLPFYSSVGGWRSLYCGVCGLAACDHDGSALKALRLYGPVQNVESVIIDGVELDPAAYRVDYRTLLIRQDGEPWPSEQDLLKPLTETGTWAVTYTRGIPVPDGGQVAAGILACELYKAAIADPTCGLPSRVRTVARQGVTVGILDSFEGLDEGKTGIWAVDSWIASVNAPRDYVGIASPDTRGRRSWAVRSTS